MRSSRLNSPLNQAILTWHQLAAERHVLFTFDFGLLVVTPCFFHKFYNSSVPYPKSANEVYNDLVYYVCSIFCAKYSNIKHAIYFVCFFPFVSRTVKINGFSKLINFVNKYAQILSIFSCLHDYGTYNSRCDGLYANYNYIRSPSTNLADRCFF